jgi:hypothetical protein
MRLVFILYAEDRGLLSSDPVYVKYYSLSGLFERLREDQGRYPDTMGQRYGSWSQLLTLFRLIYEGGSHAGLRLPAREGYLFDPDRYLFLEGRARKNEKIDVPAVPDGVVFEVLSKLFLLEGERLSYSTLDVEQIGSVYEAIMGWCETQASWYVRCSRMPTVPSSLRDTLYTRVSAYFRRWPIEWWKFQSYRYGCFWTYGAIWAIPQLILNYCADFGSSSGRRIGRPENVCPSYSTSLHPWICMLRTDRSFTPNASSPTPKPSSSAPPTSRKPRRTATSKSAFWFDPPPSPHESPATSTQCLPRDF